MNAAGGRFSGSGTSIASAADAGPLPDGVPATDCTTRALAAQDDLCSALCCLLRAAVVGPEFSGLLLSHARKYLGNAVRLLDSVPAEGGRQ